MNRQAKKTIEVVSIIGLFVFVLFSIFVFAAIPNANFNTGGVTGVGINFLNVSNTSTVEFYNVTINWTLGQTGSNITQVNITLPANITLAICANCNGTDSLQHYTFVNTSGNGAVGPVLSWTNASGVLVNATMINANASFWFNATATTAGWFNLTISILNITAAGATPLTAFYNLSIRVNDTTPPIITTNSGASVPAGESFTALKAGMNYSGNVTIRIAAREDTPVTMLFRIVNGSAREMANLTGNQSADGYWYRRLNTTDFINGSSASNLYNITIWLNDTSSTGLPGSNINNTVIFSKIRFDTIPPVVMNANITSPTAGGNYSGNLVFNITGFDSTSLIGFWNTTNTSAFSNTNGTFEASGDGFNSRAVVTINTTSYGDGYYNFSFIANDTAGNNNYTYASAAKVVSVVIDNTPPAVTLTKNTASTTTANFVVNIATTDWPSNVSGTCTHDQGDVGSVSGSGAGTQTFTRTGLNCGNSVTVQITCNDYAGNSRTRSITGTTNGCTGGDSSGGGGGGGDTSTVSWSNTFAEDDKPLSEKGEVSKSLGGKQRVKLKVVGETHYVGVASLTASTATIEVSSTPQQATLQVGDERKFDINGDGTSYDLYVKLNAIKNNKADLIIKQISEEITTAGAEEQQQAEGEAAGIAGGEQELGQVSNVSGKTIAIVIVVLVIIALVVFFVLKNKKKF